MALDRLRKTSGLSKESMSFISGAIDLKNSSANTSWESVHDDETRERIQQVAGDIEKFFRNYMYAIVNKRKYPIDPGQVNLPKDQFELDQEIVLDDSSSPGLSSAQVKPEEGIEPIEVVDKQGNATEKAPTIYFRYAYTRNIIPNQVEEFENLATQNLAGLDGAISSRIGTDQFTLQKFIDDIQKNDIVLYQPHHLSDKGRDYLNQSDIKSFIGDESERFQNSSWVAPDLAFSQNSKKSLISPPFFYADHVSRLKKRLPVTGVQKIERDNAMRNDDVDSIYQGPSVIIRAIGHKRKAGYALDEVELKRLIDQECMEYLVKQKGLSPDIVKNVKAQVEANQNVVFRDDYSKLIASHVHFYLRLFNRIVEEYKKSTGKMKRHEDELDMSRKGQDKWVGNEPGMLTIGTRGNKAHYMLTFKELKYMLKSMVKPDANMQQKIPPDMFVIPGQSRRSFPNGYDSMGREDQALSGLKNLILPPLRKLPGSKKNPNGDVVYDTDQCNFGRHHLAKYGKKLVGLIDQGWGQYCQELLVRLRHDQDLLNGLFSTPNLEASKDAVLNVLKNRTGADTFLDIMSQHKDFGSFQRDFLSRSLASEINMFYQILEEMEHGGQVYKQGPRRGELKRDSSGKPVSKFNGSVYMLVNAYMNDRPLRLRSHSGEMVDFDPMSWKELMQRLSSSLPFPEIEPDIDPQDAVAMKDPNIRINFNNPTGIFRGPSNTELGQRIDEEDYKKLRQYGYSVAKVMDIISSLMIRCCTTSYDIIDDKALKKGEVSVIGKETRSGENYSTSHGLTGHGEVMLSVRYAYFTTNQAVSGYNPVMQKMLKSEVRHRRGQRGILAGEGKNQPGRQTMHPEHAQYVSPIGQEAPQETMGRYPDAGIREHKLPQHEKIDKYDDPSIPTKEEVSPEDDDRTSVFQIVENVEWYIGQAGGGSWNKTLYAGLPWEYAVDKFQELWPHLKTVFPLMNVDMQQIENRAKQVISGVRDWVEEALQTETLVRFVNNAGQADMLDSNFVNKKMQELEDVRSNMGSKQQVPQQPPASVSPPPPSLPVQETPTTDPEVVDMDAPTQQAPSPVQQSQPSVPAVGEEQAESKRFVTKDMPTQNDFTRVMKRDKAGYGGRLQRSTFKGKKSDKDVVNTLIAMADKLDVLNNKKLADKIDRISQQLASD